MFDPEEMISVEKDEETPEGKKKINKNSLDIILIAGNIIYSLNLDSSYF